MLSWLPNQKQGGVVMKNSVREAVARSYPGWNLTHADHVIAWFDRCGYAIVDKDLLQVDAGPIALSDMEGTISPNELA
jgi:hypothetical protein